MGVAHEELEVGQEAHLSEREVGAERVQQPVAAENLTPVDMLPLMRPSADNRTRISIEYADRWRSGDVVAQSHDGAVHIKLDGDDESKTVDLAAPTYNWLEWFPGMTTVTVLQQTQLALNSRSVRSMCVCRTRI